MTAIVLDIPLFRIHCPEYGDVAKYSDDLITAYWDQAVLMSDDEDYGMLRGLPRGLMLDLLTAHLMTLFANGNAAAGASGQKGQGGYVLSSSIDKISVTKMAPPVDDAFSWWLSQTPRGQQLLALLLISSVGGLSVGGLPEGTAFRKWGGIF